MNPLEAAVATVAIIFMVAFLVESLVEYFVGLPFENVEKLKPYKWILPYFAMAGGIVMAVVYMFDLVALLSQFLGLDLQGNIVGVVVTGMAIGRGAEYMHKLISKFFVRNGPEA